MKACMTPEEWTAWDALNRTQTKQAATPCLDCLPEFACAMRAIGRCDGEPGPSHLRIPTGRPITEANRMRNRLAARRYRARLRAAA